MKANFSVVKLEDLSGSHASFYTIKFEEEDASLFEKFLSENQAKYENEVVEILDDISIMANKTGCDDSFFKLAEGKPGDGICALYDSEESKLRLYCIKYGRIIVILGSGGEKPKTMKSFQESKKLEKENYLLREISVLITERIKSGEIEFDGNDFVGELDFLFD